MSGWYTKMYKSHEVARERNRREQRRLDHDRHGPTFVAKYQLSVLDQEKRMMERELERIRKGIHKQPRFSELDRLKGNDVTGGVTNGVRSVQETPRKVDTGHSKSENALYDAMIFLQNNPSALVPIVSAHGESDAYLETLEKVSPAFQSAEEKQPFVPKFMKEKGLVTKTEKSALLDKYKFLLQRHSPILRRNSPLLDQRRNSPLLSSPKRGRDVKVGDFETDRVDSGDQSRSTPNEKRIGSRYEVSDGTHHGISPLLSNEEKENLKQGTESPDGISTWETGGQHTPQPTSSRARRALDLHELAHGGMENARDNVQRRLSVRDGEQVTTDRRTSVSEADKSADDGTPKATKATTLFPAFDPEYYNPDGSLRTQHTMPGFKERWEEAQKARYVRTREQRETDRELSLQEIFNNEKK